MIGFIPLVFYRVLSFTARKHCAQPATESKVVRRIVLAIRIVCNLWLPFALVDFLAPRRTMALSEGPKLLALAMFFGMTSDPAYHSNQERLQQLPQEAIAYPGSADAVEHQVALRQAGSTGRKAEGNSKPLQPRLL